VSPIAHFLIAWLFALIFLEKASDRRLAVIAGVMADIDGVFILFDMDLYYTYHHTLGHSYLFGIPLAALMGFLVLYRLRTGLVSLGVFSLHLFADLIGSNWPVTPFYPLFQDFVLSSSSYLSDFFIYEVINPVSFVLLMIAVSAVVLTKWVTPFEVLSERLDRRIIAILRWRYPADR
jgi:hypothetical protein